MSNSQQDGVRVVVKDRNGKIVGDFVANKEESLCTQAQDAGFDIPMSCGAGACRTCVAFVEKGKEFLDEEATSMKMIDTEEDEVLTCICGIQEEARPGAEICIRCENL